MMHIHTFTITTLYHHLLTIPDYAYLARHFITWYWDTSLRTSDCTAIGHWLALLTTSPLNTDDVQHIRYRGDTMFKSTWKQFMQQQCPTTPELCNLAIGFPLGEPIVLVQQAYGDGHHKPRQRLFIKIQSPVPHELHRNEYEQIQKIRDTHTARAGPDGYNYDSPRMIFLIQQAGLQKFFKYSTHQRDRYRTGVTWPSHRQHPLLWFRHEWIKKDYSVKDIQKNPLIYLRKRIPSNLPTPNNVHIWETTAEPGDFREHLRHSFAVPYSWQHATTQELTKAIEWLEQYAQEAQTAVQLQWQDEIKDRHEWATSVRRKHDIHFLPAPINSRLDVPPSISHWNPSRMELLRTQFKAALQQYIRLRVKDHYDLMTDQDRRYVTDKMAQWTCLQCNQKIPAVLDTCICCGFCLTTERPLGYDTGRRNVFPTTGAQEYVSIPYYLWQLRFQRTAVLIPAPADWKPPPPLQPTDSYEKSFARLDFENTHEQQRRYHIYSNAGHWLTEAQADPLPTCLNCGHPNPTPLYDCNICNTPILQRCYCGALHPLRKAGHGTCIFQFCLQTLQTLSLIHI